MIVYAVCHTDAYEGTSLIIDLYANRDDAEAAAEKIRREYPWVAKHYQVEERTVHMDTTPLLP